MDPQTEKLAREVAEVVLKGVEPRFEGIERRMQVHFEAVEELVRTTTEGYAMNLERIERRIDDLNRKVDTQLGDHDRELADHSKRIIALEKR